MSAEADRLTTDPAGDVISPRIQYLEEWIRDCQRYNRAVSVKLIAAEDRIRDLESLLEAKNAKLREIGVKRVRLGATPAEDEYTHTHLVNEAHVADSHTRRSPAAEEVEARMARWAAKDAWRDPEPDE